MIKIEFTKMNGAGNDFVMINGMGISPGILTRADIQLMCDRRRGIGADGLIIIRPSNEADFEMEYYNSDGGLGSLCGNGARSAIRFAGIKGYYKDKKTEFIVNGNRYRGEFISDSDIRFYAGTPGKVKLDFKIKAAKQLINASFADTGSPHVVIEVTDVLQNPRKPDSVYFDIGAFPVYELGKEIRNHPDFAPGGVNVNFIFLLADAIVIRTFERGVEDETLACGTGSLAAALIAHKKYKMPLPVTLLTRGGDELRVDFSESKTGYEGMILSGPAALNYTGIFELNK